MAGIRNSYVTTVSRDMKAAGHHCQTGETAMDRVGPLLSSALFEEGRRANDHIIKNSVERGELKKKLFVAIDTHNVYRHTKIPIGKKLRKRSCSDILTVIGRKPKNNACYAHEYMTLQNIKMRDEPTYVLAFDRVLPLQNRTKTTERLIEENESKTNATIALLVEDGGFDDGDTMKMCKKRGIHFVFRADKEKKVKANVDEVEKNDRKYHVV